MAILSIVLAVVVSHAIGWFWYSQAGFGKMWMKLMGIHMDAAKEGGKGMAKSMVVSVVLGFVTAGVLYGLITTYGVLFGCIVATWFGLAFPVYAHAALWDNKSWKLVFLNAGHGLVSIMAMAGVIYWML